jgi:transcriptional regulator
VVTLRREGWSVQEIADVLGCSAAAVHNDLTEVLAQSVNETAETTAEARQLQAERLDMMLKQFMPMTQDRVVKIVDPDQPYRLDEEGERVPNYRDTIIPASLAAAQMVIQIEARRSKLQALDVPETKNLNVTGVREYIGVDVEQV